MDSSHLSPPNETISSIWGLKYYCIILVYHIGFDVKLVDIILENDEHFPTLILSYNFQNWTEFIRIRHEWQLSNPNFVDWWSIWNWFDFEAILMLK